MIEFRNVQAGRPGVSLMENFNWSIADGESWLISGSNGSGKTLVLELLAGRISPARGELVIDFITGEHWDERYTQRKRLIHYVPTHAVQSLLRQDQHQYYQQRYYSIGDQRTPLTRDILGVSQDELNSINLPPEFAIDSLLPIEVNRLSNGQLKKLLLIKILLTGVPRLLLLDYPFEGLDSASRTALCAFVDYLIDVYGVQVILVDQHNEVPARIKQVLVLDHFRIAHKGVRHNAVAEDRHGPVVSRTTSARDVMPAVVKEVEPVVEVRDLKIQYGDHVVLRDFNWRVNRGERWALVGRNGAGKTTLFSMIFADHPMAYSQYVYLFGRRRGTGESIWDIKRRIGYLGPEQLSYLSPAHINITAHDFLRQSMNVWDAERCVRLADAFEAQAFLHLPVRALSSGQLQVVMIIRCLMTECELLLLDEPFQFLDARRKAALTHVLQTFLDNSKTLILITHYEADLAEWTDHTKQL